LQPVKLSVRFKDKLALRYSPVGLYFAENRPDKAMGFKNGKRGCIMPLIFSAARGKTIAFDKNSTGWDCSAFYLGYRDWISPGIEHFLSKGSLTRPHCERFIKTPDLAKAYLESIRFQEVSEGTAIFKPLEMFSDSELPEVVTFFANPDQLSALVFLLHFDNPCSEDRVVTRFASACASVSTLPLQYARNGEKKAVWGLHDITARLRLPENLMTITMPYPLLTEIGEYIDSSFLTTDSWNKIAKRIN
jgi:hypothetical protein